MKKLAVAVCAVVAGMAQAEESAQIAQLRADLAAAAAGATVVVPAGTHLLESRLNRKAYNTRRSLDECRNARKCRRTS